MRKDDKVFVKRRFERIYNMIACKSYFRNDDNPGNKEISVHGFDHFKTDKVDKYILIGCESNELNENHKLFNFWSRNLIKKRCKREIPS